MGGRKTKGGFPVSGQSHMAEALNAVNRPQQPIGTSLALRQPVPPCTCSTRTARPAKSRTLVRLYLYDAVLEGLAQDFQDVAAKLRELIEKQDTMVPQRHLARCGDVPADQPRIEDRLRRGATQGPGDDRGAGAGAAKTRWIRVVSRAFARHIAGDVGVKRGASFGISRSGGPRRMHSDRWLVIMRERPLSN
jgi:hypothetical protein